MSRSYMKLAIVVLLPTSFPHCLMGQDTSTADPLNAYTRCTFNDPLRVKDITRRPQFVEPYRDVTTDKGKERVSVLDGYRVMVGYKDSPNYYANIKIEQSDVSLRATKGSTRLLMLLREHGR